MSEGVALSSAQIDSFVHRGFIRVDRAFPRELADACRALLWSRLECSPTDPRTWNKPVVRLGLFSDPPFVAAANTPALVEAFDALVGKKRWLPCGAVGTFPIRFPTETAPDDCGWHVDPSFGWEDEPNFLNWRVNVFSRGRALLMLFLFSDVGEADAPTRLRVGSHLDVARRLAPHGAAGLTLGELAEHGFAESAHRDEALAVGPAGTVYLCHPFLVHSAQPHRGKSPRFLAQPPLLPRTELDPWRELEASPVERAIRLGVESSKLE